MSAPKKAETRVYKPFGAFLSHNAYESLSGRSSKRDEVGGGRDSGWTRVWVDFELSRIFIYTVDATADASSSGGTGRRISRTIRSGSDGGHFSLVPLINVPYRKCNDVFVHATPRRFVVTTATGVKHDFVCM
jgi:hypothetical protein